MTSPSQPSHQIRLLGPWQVTAIAPLMFVDNPEQSQQRVKFPTCWSDVFGDQTGSARFIRKFNSPTGLNDQQIFVRLPYSDAITGVQLNDHEMSGVTQNDEMHYDITARLQDRNSLTIEVEFAHSASEPLAWTAGVALEIAE